MASVNKVILIGNLGRDPELRFTRDGQGVANFTLATNERWRDKDGQNQERTEWHRIVVWGKQAENCAQYLQKGRSCYIEGRIQMLEDRLARAQVIDASGQSLDQVRFGFTIDLEDAETGEKVTYAILGEEGTDLSPGTSSVR